MAELKQDVMQQAIERYHQIFPCARYESLADCFTVEGNRLYFWFNTEDESTHVMVRDI